ncbi:MAG: CDP-diacylglycerol--glycerol-3-phosphate 3-phosphatidyltransferase [Pseudomonadota bacterium]
MDLTTLPNILTLSRIAAVPIIVLLFFLEMWFGHWWIAWISLGLFIAAAVTDYIDGELARRTGQTSPMGRLMDPIADKMLVSACLLMLVGIDRISGLALIPTLIILTREIMVAGLREFLAEIRATGIPSSILAKWKTTAQLAAIGFLIVGPHGPFGWPILEIGLVLLWIAGGLTVITGWQYTNSALSQIAASLAGRGS